MTVQETIEQLRLFPQGAEIKPSEYGLTVCLFGYWVEGQDDCMHTPAYTLPVEPIDLPWLHDGDWFTTHKMPD